MMKQNILPIENGYLSWETTGNGNPLVLAHGFSFNRRSWDQNIDYLKNKYQIINYDLRGFGSSSIPEQPYSHSDDLHELLEHLNIKKPILLGVSLGANVMLEYAEKYPHYISGLIMTSPGLPGFQWNSERPPEAAANHARKHGIEAGKEFWFNHDLFNSLQDFPKTKQDVEKMVGEYNGWHWVNDNPVIWNSNLADNLSKIDTETLIISGEKDVPGYRIIANHLDAKMKNATLINVKNAGHMINLELPDKFHELVDNFTRNLRED